MGGQVKVSGAEVQVLVFGQELSASTVCPCMLCVPAHSIYGRCAYPGYVWRKSPWCLTYMCTRGLSCDGGWCYLKQAQLVVCHLGLPICWVQNGQLKRYIFFLLITDQIVLSPIPWYGIFSTVFLSVVNVVASVHEAKQLARSLLQGKSHRHVKSIKRIASQYSLTWLIEKDCGQLWRNLAAPVSTLS